jgi:hypothetical protein
MADLTVSNGFHSQTDLAILSFSLFSNKGKTDITNF